MKTLCFEVSSACLREMVFNQKKGIKIGLLKFVAIAQKQAYFLVWIIHGTPWDVMVRKRVGTALPAVSHQSH